MTSPSIWKLAVAFSLAGLLGSLGLLADTHLRYGAPLADSHAVVEDVLPGSPAAMVGIRPGDIILAVDSVDTPMEQLKARIGGGCGPTAMRRLLVERDGEAYNVAVRTHHRKIGVHFGRATRYVIDPLLALRSAYRAWQAQAFTPFEVAAAWREPCPFGQRHVLPIHSTPHRRAAITGAVLFWGSLFSLFGAFAVALRRRRV